MSRIRRAAQQPAREYVSWVPSDRSVTSAGPLRRSLERWRDGAWFDTSMALLAALLFDLIALLVFSGYQSARCGGTCGLNSQLQLLRDGTVFLIAVPLLSVLVALAVRRHRIALALLQVVLFSALLVNNLSSQHRLESRLNGTATCWTTVYSNKDCPWGVRD